MQSNSFNAQNHLVTYLLIVSYSNLQSREKVECEANTIKDGLM